MSSSDNDHDDITRSKMPLLMMKLKMRLGEPVDLFPSTRSGYHHTTLLFSLLHSFGTSTTLLILVVGLISNETLSIY